MTKKGDWRIYFLLIVFVLIYGAIFSRLFLVQVIKHKNYAALAQDQYQIIKKLTPRRGDIFVQEKNGAASVLATSREMPLVFLVPREILKKEETAKELSRILGIEENLIVEKISKSGDPYEPLKSKLSEQEEEQIKNLNLNGVYLSTENLRWYPQKSLASHLLGFVGYDGDQKIGQYGLEGYYEENLAGRPGLLEAGRDALGKWVLFDDYDLKEAKNGDQFFLTIDPNIQFLAEQKLKALLERWQSAAGSIIISEPKTGAILAMASQPDFDPNEYYKIKNINDFLNPVTQKLYEPGSIFKPFTMAAGLDTGKVSPDTTYVDTGSVLVGGNIITNALSRSYGLSNMSKVLEKSINTGAVFVQQKVGNEDFRKYVEAFGFSRPTGIDLAGEIAGNISNLKGEKEIDFATASFGQGIAVTPLQIVAGISAIANEGKLMKPYLVDRIVHSDGSEEKSEPKEIRQVISAQTANKLTAMLVNTVRQGYDKIKINNYFIAGKTGTAQVPNADAPGYSDQTVHSFIGYAPAYDPKFLVFIKMDKPKGINFASDSLTPVFAEIAKYLFNYYDIPPDDK